MPDPSRRWEQVIAGDLDRRRDARLYRQRRIVRPLDATHVEWGGRELVNFSSNNYLGLTHHPRIRAAVEQSVAANGFGAGAAGLISGHGQVHESAERAIALWKGTESAILLPSGWQANQAAIQTAAAIGKMAGGVRFLVDKLAHASLIDAIRGSGRPFRSFHHNHIAKLQRLLEEADNGELQVVVTESLFSMDGDAADLHALAQLKMKYDFLLILDEAHATGVYVPAGEGLAAELGLREAVDVSILTLSKGLGGIGGAICGSQLFCDAVVNYGRAYIFSTAIPAALAAAGEAAVGVLRDEPHRRQRVRALARHVRAQIGRSTFRLAPAATPGDRPTFVIPPGDSPIIPIILGDEQSAIGAAEQMLAAGMLVLPVRPPSVPRGSSRLRVTLSSEHTDAEVGLLIDAIGRIVV